MVRYLTLSHEHGSVGHWRGFSKGVGNSSNHFVEDHDWRFWGQDFSQTEIDPLLLDGVGQRLEGLALKITQENVMLQLREH